MVERFAKEDVYKVEAPADYSQMSFEEKNKTKYMCTFPYPYMNGYLHLGKKQSFDVFRSRIFSFKSRILSSLPTLDWQACAFPIWFSLYRYANLSSSQQT